MYFLLYSSCQLLMFFVSLSKNINSLISNTVLPESAVSSNHGEVTHPSDIIENKNQPELGGPCHIEDEILIYNGTVRDGMNNFDEVKMQPPAAVKVDQGNPISLDSNMLTDDQPPTRMRSRWR